MFKTVAKTVAGIFSVSMAKDFISKMATVRGEFQQLEMGFKTMLGSAEQADKLMSQLVRTAATTPFGMSDIAQASKQLLAYGVEADKVNDTLIRLGDIAAGLSIPIGDLAYLYGTTMVQGRMFTMDLRQFTGRGIPMTEALAEVMGVAKDEVAGLVTAGKVGFKEMEQAIVNLTSEGSKFGGLMEAQSKTITGQLSNLEDAIEQMFNEIGKKTEGAISGTISVVSTLVENYEKIGRVLASLVTAYGGYKAAILALAAANKIAATTAAGHTVAELARVKALRAVASAHMLLNKTMLANPYVAAGAAIGAMSVSLFKLAKNLDTGAEGSERFNKAMKERTKLYEDEDKAIKESIKTLKDETASKEERLKAFNTLHDLYPDIFKDYAQEQEYLKNISELEKEIAAQRLNRAYTEDTTRLSDLKTQKAQLEEAISINQRSAAGSQAVTQLRNELRAVEKEIAAYEEKLKGDEYADMFIGPQPKKAGATDNATKTQNKEYWENLKKEATAELEALTEVEAKGAKGAELKKKILEYDKILSAYGTGSKGSGKGTSSDDDRETIQNNFYKQYGSYQKRLKMLSDEWDKTIKSFDEGSADRALAEKQKTYALAAFSYDWLKDNSVDRDAIREALVKQLDAEIVTLDGAAKEAAEARKKVTLAEFDTETGSSKNEYLKAWGTMQEKRAAISKEYDDKILAAKDEWAKKSLEKEKEGALYDFDTQNSEQLKKFFLDPAKQSKSLLKENIAYAQTLLEKYKDQPDVLKDVNEQLAQMQDEYNGIDFEGYEAGVSGVISKMTELNNLYRKQAELTKEGKTSGTEWEVNEAAIERSKKQLKRALVATGVDEFVGGLQEAADLMQQIADTTEDVNLADAASMLSSFSQNLSSAWEGAKSGGWIGAIVGGVTDWIQQAVGAYTEARVAEAQYAREHEEFIRKINLANLSVDADAYETIFGTLEISKGIEGWQKAQDAIKQYEEYVNKAYTETTAKQKRSDRKMYGGWGGLIFSAGATFNPFKGSDKYTNQYLQQLDAVERGLTELQAMSVKTKSRNGFQKFWGAEDQYKSLIDYAPQLWDEDGAFNVENAKLLLETSTKLTDTQKDQIQNAINLKEAYDEAMEAVDESISSMFSSLGEDMSDAIWDSVVNGGEDAWSQFQEIGGETIANLGKQMLKEMIISDFLNEYKEKFREAYQSGDAQDVASNVAQVTADMLTAAKDKVDVWSAAVQGFYDQAKASGFDVSDDSERGTTSGGITSMSQESADELNGRFTAIQGHTYQINENVELLKEQHLMLVSNTGAILSHVMGIHSDTSDIRAVQQEMRDTLAEVRSIAKSTSDDILLKGIKIK